MFFLTIFVLAFVLLCIFAIGPEWSDNDSWENLKEVLIGLVLSAAAAGFLWMVAFIIVDLCVTPSTRIVDSTATLLPVNLNDGKVALGYEVMPYNTEGKWYVYKDEQDKGTKYLFIEETDNQTDLGIDVKLIDANKCEIKYVDDEEPCKVEYYHTEYGGFARAITRKASDGITLCIHKKSIEDIWFPYSN